MTERCGICDAETGAAAPRMAGAPICRACVGCGVAIRSAASERLLARTFFVRSLSGRVVKVIARRFTCTCPDYVHRGQVVRQPCKHVRLLRLVARAAGGLRQIPRGAAIEFRVSDALAVRQRMKGVA